MTRKYFIDGTPIPEDYLHKLNIQIKLALDAEIYFELDELETKNDRKMETSRKENKIPKE